MGKFKLGCGTWPYMFPPYDPRPYTLEECLQMISRLKFDGVELSGFKPHAHPDLYPKKSDRHDLKSKIAGYGLEIVGIAADLSGNPIASPYSDVREAHEKSLDTFLQFCQDLDIKSMRVDTVSGPEGVPGVPYETAWNRVETAFKKYSKKAEDAGVVLVWEFEPGFMLNKPSEVLKLLRAVNQPNFKAMIDTCHAHCCGIGLNQSLPLDIIDVPLSKIAGEFITRLKGMIGHVHVIDSNNTLNQHRTSTHAPFKKGMIDFDEVMKALNKVGYSGWLGLDLCFWPNAWEETGSCKQFMDQLVAKYR